MSQFVSSGLPRASVVEPSPTDRAVSGAFNSGATFPQRWLQLDHFPRPHGQARLPFVGLKLRQYERCVKVAALVVNPMSSTSSRACSSRSHITVPLAMRESATSSAIVLSNDNTRR